jgi:hypothetical protein
VGRIIRREFVGFATCWTRPWWKIYIRVYRDLDENGRTCYYCDNCKNVCDHYEIWFRNPWDKKRMKKILVLSLLLLSACIPYIEPEPDKCLNVGAILEKYHIPDEYSLHLVWWNMTKKERIRATGCIVDRANLGNIKKIRRSPVEEWESAMCLSNAIVRWARFGDPKRYYNQDSWDKYGNRVCNLNTCEYRTGKGDFLVIPPKTYHLPCYVVNATGERPNGKFYGHTVNAIQVGKNITDLNSWYFFQYSDNPIIPWGEPSQIPPFTKIEILVDNPEYMHYRCDSISCYGEPCVLVEWEPQNE